MQKKKQQQNLDSTSLILFVVKQQDWLRLGRSLRFVSAPPAYVGNLSRKDGGRGEGNVAISNTLTFFIQIAVMEQTKKLKR